MLETTLANLVVPPVERKTTKNWWLLFYLGRVDLFSWYQTIGFFNQTLWRQDGGNCQSGDLLHVPQCQDNHRNRRHSFSFSNHNHANQRATLNQHVHKSQYKYNLFSSLHYNQVHIGIRRCSRGLDGILLLYDLRGGLSIWFKCQNFLFLVKLIFLSQ